MTDFLSRILLDDSDTHATSAASDAYRQLRALRDRGDRTLVARAESEVGADADACFRLDTDGNATLQVDAGRWCAGRLETPSVGELRASLDRLQSVAPQGRLRLFVLEGASPLTDIGWLQATAPGGCAFQVASQFNCLESPGPYLVSGAGLPDRSDSGTARRDRRVPSSTAETLLGTRCRRHSLRSEHRRSSDRSAGRGARGYRCS